MGDEEKKTSIVTRKDITACRIDMENFGGTRHVINQYEKLLDALEILVDNLHQVAMDHVEQNMKINRALNKLQNDEYDQPPAEITFAEDEDEARKGREETSSADR